MNWSDEKKLVLTSYIASSIILVTLSFEVGVISFIFTFLYWKFKKIQFSRDGKYLDLISIAIAIILGIGIYNILQPFGIFTSFKEFSVDNPILKTVIWGVFLPLPETLFFFGVLMPWLSDKTGMSMRMSLGGLVLVFLLALSASVYHIYAQVVTPENVIADIAFFGISGLVVLYFKELKQSYYTHAFINTRTMAVKEGLIKAGGLLVR